MNEQEKEERINELRIAIKLIYHLLEGHIKYNRPAYESWTNLRKKLLKELNELTS